MPNVVARSPSHGVKMIVPQSSVEMPCRRSHQAAAKSNGNDTAHKHRRDDDAGDQPCVHPAEPERAGESWAASNHHDQRGQTDDRPEQPVVVEEPLVPDPRPHGTRAEHRLRIELRQTEIGGHLRPPQDGGCECPHDCRDG